LALASQNFIDSIITPTKTFINTNIFGKTYIEINISKEE